MWILNSIGKKHLEFGHAKKTRRLGLHNTVEKLSLRYYFFTIGQEKYNCTVSVGGDSCMHPAHLVAVIQTARAQRVRPVDTFSPTQGHPRV